MMWLEGLDLGFAKRELRSSNQSVGVESIFGPWIALHLRYVVDGFTRRSQLFKSALGC